MRWLRNTLRMDRTTPAKAPDFSPTKSQIYVDPITIMDLNMHYDVQQREKNMQQKIKLLLDAGSLCVFQHHADNDFIIV